MHFSAIASKGYRTLEAGQQVYYDTERDPKNAGRLRAANVTLA